MTEFDKVIPPGGSGKVTAAIHTTNFKGAITKMVNVTTNDPDHAHVSLTIKANVTVPIDVQPSENVAFNGKSDQLKPQELTVSAAGGEVFDITEAKPQDANFTVSVEAAPETGDAPKPKAGTVASGVSRYKVTITPAKELPVGRLSSGVTLKTTHPKAAEVPIRIFGNVSGDVDVVPQYVTLSTGANAAPEAKVQHVAIRKATGDPLKITDVSSDNPSVATKLTTVSDGREYDLEVKYTGEPSTTALTSKVKLTTNDARQPSIEVQIWGRVDPGMRPPMAQGPVTITPMPMPKPVPATPTP